MPRSVDPTPSELLEGLALRVFVLDWGELLGVWAMSTTDVGVGVSVRAVHTAVFAGLIERGTPAADFRDSPAMVVAHVEVAVHDASRDHGELRTYGSLGTNDDDRREWSIQTSDAAGQLVASGYVRLAPLSDETGHLAGRLRSDVEGVPDSTSDDKYR